MPGVAVLVCYSHLDADAIRTQLIRTGNIAYEPYCAKTRIQPHEKMAKLLANSIAVRWDPSQLWKFLKRNWFLRTTSDYGRAAHAKVSKDQMLIEKAQE